MVQGLFGGRSWQHEPALKETMFEAFRIMRSVHENLQLLHAARRLALSDAEAARCAELELAHMPQDGWTLARLREFERGPVSASVRAFLRSLRYKLGGTVRPA
ncbi:MAG: hypothetical protein JJ864_00030 [Rhizobiaceae bacterium]|nr:hypothetical protein [Rhizobiaceae bacterium]